MNWVSRSFYYVCDATKTNVSRRHQPNIGMVRCKGNAGRPRCVSFPISERMVVMSCFWYTPVVAPFATKRAMPKMKPCHSGTKRPINAKKPVIPFNHPHFTPRQCCPSRRRRDRPRTGRPVSLTSPGWCVVVVGVVLRCRGIPVQRGRFA